MKTTNIYNILNKPASDFEQFQKTSSFLFEEVLKNKSIIDNLLTNAFNNEHLFQLSEHYDILDKLVLYSSETSGFRLRLHLFADEYFDRPHNHRWSYSSLILNGSYKHTIYNVDKIHAQNPSPHQLYPVIIRSEKAGDSYTLHWSQYHSVVANPNTVTLVLRGPPEQERFRVMDNTTGEAWWQYGRKDEDKQEIKNKQITKEQYDLALKKLHSIELI